MKNLGELFENVDGNFIVGHHEGKLGIRNKDGHLIRTLKYEMDGGFLDVAIGVNDEIVGLKPTRIKSDGVGRRRSFD